MKKLYWVACVLILVGAGCNRTPASVESPNSPGLTDTTESIQSTSDYIFKSYTDYFICKDGKIFRSDLNNMQLGEKKAYNFAGTLSGESIAKIKDLFGKKSINFISDYKPDPNIISEYMPCSNFEYFAGQSTRKVNEKECKNLWDGLSKITNGVKTPYNYAIISIIKPGDKQYDAFSSEVTKRLDNVNYANLFNNSRVLYDGYMQTNQNNKVVVVKPQDINPTALAFASSDEVRGKSSLSEIAFRVASPDATGTDYLVIIRPKNKYILSTSYTNLCGLQTDADGKIITNESLDSDGDGVSDEIELLLVRDPFDATNNDVKYIH